MIGSQADKHKVFASITWATKFFKRKRKSFYKIAIAEMLVLISHWNYQSFRENKISFRLHQSNSIEDTSKEKRFDYSWNTNVTSKEWLKGYFYRRRDCGLVIQFIASTLRQGATAIMQFYRTTYWPFTFSLPRLNFNSKESSLFTERGDLHFSNVENLSSVKIFQQ